MPGSPGCILRSTWSKHWARRLAPAVRLCLIGDLVSLGRLSGVADPFGIKLRGLAAWAMWKFYYLLNLVGWQNRLRVVLNWLLALLFPTHSAISHECSPECSTEMCL